VGQRALAGNGPPAQARPVPWYPSSVGSLIVIINTCRDISGSNACRSARRRMTVRYQARLVVATTLRYIHAAAHNFRWVKLPQADGVFPFQHFLDFRQADECRRCARRQGVGTRAGIWQVNPHRVAPGIRRARDAFDLKRWRSREGLPAGSSHPSDRPDAPSSPSVRAWDSNMHRAVRSTQGQHKAPGSR